MGDTPEQQAAKDALATIGKWRGGQSYGPEGPGPFDTRNPNVWKNILGEFAKAARIAEISQQGGFNQATYDKIQRAEAGLEGEAPPLTGALPFIGSTLGAVLGRRFGPVGEIAGAGLGAGAGRVANPLVGATDPSAGRLVGTAAPSPLQVGMDVAGGAVGQGLGMGVAKTAQVGFSPFAARPAPGASALRQQFQDVGGGSRMTPVEMNVADVSPNMAALERSVAQTPTGGPIIRAAADRRAGQLSRAADDFLDTVAPAAAGERVVVGQKASDAITRHVERTGALEDVLWHGVGQQARDLPVNIRGLKAAAADVLLQEQRGLKPNASLVALAQQIHQHGDEVPWQVADAWRKEFGRNIKSGELISGLPSGENKLLYRSLLTDMEASADASGVTGLSGSYKNLRTFAEHRRAIFRDGEVAKILETDPEKVVSLLNVAGGPTAIKRAREAIVGSPELGLVAPSPADQEAWNYVRRHILEGAFTKATTEQYKGLSNPVIVGSKLDKALKTIGEDGLRELLSEQERAALKNLVAVAKAMRASESIGALPGTSTTPQGLGFMNLITAVPATLGALAGGVVGGPAGAGVGGGVASSAAFILVPHAIAKLLTNPTAAAIMASPAFAGLATGVKMTAAAANEGTRALARLGGILFAEQSQQEEP